MNTAYLIEQMLRYAEEKGITSKADIDWARNMLLDLFGLQSAFEGEIEPYTRDMPVALLDRLCDAAVESGIITENTVAQRELFDARIMGLLLPKPSQTADIFEKIYERDGTKAATDWFYALCQRSNYIRTASIAKNIYYTAPSKYGTLEITINLSKPEFTPAEIVAMKNAAATSYPKCPLCHENEGFAGRVGKPARQTLRCIPVTLNGEQWYFQYSPYVYYNEHCIAYAGEHSPMKIDGNTARRLFDFVDRFPHYFIGSNSDLPIVGGSILSHNHFQGGCHRFAMQDAPVRFDMGTDTQGVKTEIIDWPLSTVRFSGADRRAIENKAERLITAWRTYTDEEAFIFAETDGEKHNTVTSIADKKTDGTYELYIVLRNNITTEEHPLGVFHPHKELHNIKIEGIGLIEVMGLFVLPARLDRELPLIERILAGEKVNDECLDKHAHWIAELTEKFGTANTPDEAHRIVREEMAHKCAAVLETCGVFKHGIHDDKFKAFVGSI